MGCITYAAICNMKRFALSGLVHPHGDVYVWMQSVLTRPCIYTLSGRIGCSMRSFGACDLAMYLYAEACKLRDASLSRSWECITYSATCKMKRFTFSGLVHPNGDSLASSVPLRPCIDVPLSPDRVNKLHRGASMPEVVVHTAGCFASAGRMYLYGDAWAPTEAGRACIHMLHGP